MSCRAALASFALAGALLASSSAGAQPYGPPRYGGEYYPPQPRSRSIQDYPAYRPRREPPGPWDCDENRCINAATGALWESTCNYRGCFPLRPARPRAYREW